MSYPLDEVLVSMDTIRRWQRNVRRWEQMAAKKKAVKRTAERERVGVCPHCGAPVYEKSNKAVYTCECRKHLVPAVVPMPYFVPAAYPVPVVPKRYYDWPYVTWDTTTTMSYTSCTS